MKKFLIIGSLAHQSRPKKIIDFRREVTAQDAVDARTVYRQQLRGVKRSKILEVRELQE